MLFSDRRLISGPMILVIAGLAGFLTWLCSIWLGGLSPLTAMIAVVLVELMLAGFGVIGILLTERMTLTLLNAEKRAPRAPKPRSRPAPVWRRLPDDPVAPMASDRPALTDDVTDNNTLPFPVTENGFRPEPADPLRRAA